MQYAAAVSSVALFLPGRLLFRFTLPVVCIYGVCGYIALFFFFSFFSFF